MTDQRMTRFWITLNKGVEFVLNVLDIMRGGEIFVPKISSMKIMDLVDAIAPGCEVKFTGIRPGEKIHEVLVSTDEARQTLEFPDMFLIQPSHSWWGNDVVSDGKTLADDFEYGSNNNSEWLTAEELAEMVAAP